MTNEKYVKNGLCRVKEVLTKVHRYAKKPTNKSLPFIANIYRVHYSSTDQQT